MKSLILAIFLTGCGTIIPHPIPSTHASISETGKPDSGVIGLVPGGWHITASAADRYNALIAAYGHDPEFLPPLVPMQGVTIKPDGTIILDREGMRRFALLAAWHRMGRPVVKPTLIERVKAAL